MTNTYTGSLYAPAPEYNFDPSILAEFVVLVLRDPNNRPMHASKLYAGDWNRAAALLRYAETPEFTDMLLAARSNMTKNEQAYSKEEFVIAVQDKLAVFEGELWLKTAQFFAKLQGYIVDAPTVAIQNNNVIQVPAKPADANTWEQQATQHQAALQSEARIIHD